MKREIFLPKFKPIDMSDPIIFEKYKNKKIYRISQLVKCPTIAIHTRGIEEATGKILEYPDDSRENFIQGTGVHSKEEILRAGSKEIIQAEKQLYIYNAEDDYLIKGTPDELKLDFQGPYLNDFKSCKPGAFYFKIKGNKMSWNHKAQLSSYRYLIYVNTGIDVEEGTITFVDKENPRRRLVIADMLNRLIEVEEFFLTHPMITGKNVAEKTKEYLESGMGFVCKLCMLAQTCPFFTGDKKSLKDALENKKESDDLEEVDDLLKAKS